MNNFVGYLEGFLEYNVEFYFTDRELFLIELDYFLDSSYKKGLLVGWDYFFVPKSGDIFSTQDDSYKSKSFNDLHDIRIILTLDNYPNRSYSRLEFGVSELNVFYRDKKIKSILNEEF